MIFKAGTKVISLVDLYNIKLCKEYTLLLDYDSNGADRVIVLKEYPMSMFLSSCFDFTLAMSQSDGLKLWADKTKDELDKKKTETELRALGMTIIKKCECGADKVDSPFHSIWCPKHAPNI